MNNRILFKGSVPPAIVTLILVGMFLSLMHNTNKKYKSIFEDLEKGSSTIVLSPACNEKKLSDIIFNNGYADSEDDADFIAAILIKNQKEDGRLPSLYTLQKRAFGQIPARMADSCGVLLSQLQRSLNKLGINDDIIPFNKDSIRDGVGIITVNVYEKIESPIWWKKKLNLKEQRGCVDVPVRLTTHYRDSMGVACSSIVGFVQTDSAGQAIFEGLDTEMSYSVLPINRGYEYGTSRGTIDGVWETDKLVFNFEEKEHRIPLFSNSTLKQIKTDKTILVRSPREYKSDLVRWFIFSILAWWVLCFIRYRKKQINDWLVASCMFLTELSILMMFSMQDPLLDELYGVTMGQGVVIGLVVCACFQGVDFIKFYQGKYKISFDIPDKLFKIVIKLVKWIFKPYRNKINGLASLLKGNGGVPIKMIAVLLVLLSLPLLLMDLLFITRLSKRIDKIDETKLPKGIGWLVMALLITALLWSPFGQSVGGMLVNLNILGIKFQPSEIAKYFIIFFMSALFTQHADTIVAYSLPNRLNKLGQKFKTLLWIFLGLFTLLTMYIVLGDMGPGLVIGTTFIILYSLIKSKVNLSDLGEEDRWKKILTCDFAMMVYGMISFVAFLLGGYLLGGKDIMFLFALLWLLFWLFLGYYGLKKQLFESAIMFCLVIFMFIFGGGFLGLIDQEAGERFEGRVSMCSNTWGTIDIEHLDADLIAPAEPVSNTQVAEGLWALASGGQWGQGWAKGKPSLIPAYHTDMVLSSIGEVLGWVGLLMVLLALYILLRKIAVVGYRVGHPFALYLCLGIAIVIGVQFFIIALGSTGVIPLTGVTVPFLSYGRVSMILNLSAFGVVLSLSNNIERIGDELSEKVRQSTIDQYSYPIAILTMLFTVIAVSTLLIWQSYQVWNRNSTLIRSVYVLNNEGYPEIKRNPRIDLLEDKMFAGRIYDRKNRLLATSDKNEINIDTCVTYGLDRTKLVNLKKRNQKRYYPFGEHMVFMVGDQNEDLMFSYDDDWPIGYMAEVQHLSYLRDFDNLKYDENGNIIKIRLKTDRKKDNTYLAPGEFISNKITLRDYKDLLRYLKDGIEGDKVAKHNEKVKEEKYDLHLTVDAALQTDLQNSISAYVKNDDVLKDYNLMRISVVVLDAQNGELLASANYPIPDYDRLRDESDNKYYSDNEKDRKWIAYTDRDLGTTFQTAPGSTAKVISAMAGFKKLGTDASKVSYRITNANAIEKNNKGIAIEPTIDKHDPVTMKDAIVESSNCYFISLVNDKDLYKELGSIYSSAGINIGGITPYYYSNKNDDSWEQGFNNKIENNRQVALRKYEQFKQGKLKDPKDSKIKPMNQTNMSIPEWKWAWGQGYSDDNKRSFEILASPLNMARIASAVVNGGTMPITQYLMPINKYEKKHRDDGVINLIKQKEAKILKEYMFAEAKNQTNRNHITLPTYVGGKTGTPERSRVLKKWQVFNKNQNKYIDKIVLENNGTTNDGWYVFFVDGSLNGNGQSLAVAVRMERLRNDLNSSGSGAAVKLTNEVLLGCLGRKGYIINKDK